METYFGSFQIARILIWRVLAGVYFVAFISALNQFPTLLGSSGFLPAPEFIRHVPFKNAPGLFYLHYSDTFLAAICWIGILISSLTLIGITEKGPWWLITIAWLTLWVLYLSIVNVGQTFYGFGWESMILEAGFFASFLGSPRLASSVVPILILRWMLFRTELGAGLIKLRGDTCWRDLTCLQYHYETQPMPNTLSWFFHQLPGWFQKWSVVFSHFVQLIVPFGLFAPQGIAAVSGLLIILHQLILIISGNYSWLNWLTVVLGLSAFSDSFFNLFSVKTWNATMRSLPYNCIIGALALLTIALSIQPTLNLFSKRQLMNFRYNPLHLIGSYGAFGSVTKERYEIVLEGTQDAALTASTIWQEYEFKAKPGDVKRSPPQFAPYHLRLDWLMWFLPFSVQVTPQGLNVPGYERWYLRFVYKLLQAEPRTLKLIKNSPFKKDKPQFIRARYYRYHFTTPQERTATGAWWKRTLIGEYMPPVKAENLQKL